MTDHNKQTKEQSKSLQTDRKTNLILGSIVATLIAITPYIFYSYESVPDEKVWDTFLFTYNSGFYENANTAIWVMMGKIVPIFLLFIWFFTCRHWWYHVLLIPIAMYVYQLFSIINDDGKFVDEYQIMFLIPIMAVIVPSIYLIRAKMFNKLTSKNMQELEDEFRISRKTFKDFF
jgi:glucan phosphoethanolaminetransferase (alkaline phosphatase superfamily)